ncbi:hypothetical protein AB0K14_20415 [Actinosynnema sp. NPDC050801]|uniref:hypothetical protein n=1 Tax=unclassified Actinosynnema TaxID=2637065 RepID=UPI003404C87E
MSTRFRIKVARFMWPTAPPGAVGSLPWPQPVYRAIFGKLVRDYWARATFGIVDLDFDLTWPAFVRLGDLDPALARDRGQALSAIRRYAESELDLHTDGYDGFVAMVNPPPCDAGALGKDALLDQGGSLEFFQHEIGHVLGFDHVFPVYDDRYCVMGETWSWDHAIAPPPEAQGIPFLSPLMWRSGRRLSAASLFRRFGRFGMPGNPLFAEPYVVDVGLGQSVLLSAVSETTTPRPVVAIVPIVLGLGGLLTVEYRTATHDDVGLGQDAIVVHSIGHRNPGPGHREVKPVWREAALPIELGASASVPGARITVGRIRPPALFGAPLPDGPSRVYVSVNRDV